MDDNLLKQLKAAVKGDILVDEETLRNFSHDASIFSVMPQVVVEPRGSEDVKNLVNFVSKNKKSQPSLSLTARSAGTDMSGGAINDSIIISFTKYMNSFKGINAETATAEPGMFYRDFEKETLKKGLIFPSYPASREICAIGGMVNNNAGGEKSLKYGKTENFIESLKVVLADGNEYELKALSVEELKKKLEQKDFEGQLYKNLYELITKNYELLKKARPQVSKNSSGYYLWNVYDKEKGTFDLTKLFVGSQGTLGITTEATLKLAPSHKHQEMMIIFLYDLTHLAEIINIVLPLEPESFESYDDNVLKLALRYFPEFSKLLGTKNILQTAWDFMPEFKMLLFGGLPKLILQVDFTGDDPEELKQKIEVLRERLGPMHPKIHIAEEGKAQKYWAIRRESFNLLRNKVRDRHAAPFIDDIVVNPQYLPEFLPKFNLMLKKYPSLTYTVQGHVGDGNFHVIPLVNLEKDKELIPKIMDEVFDLVLSYHGSISGEHNDGLIRSHYLEKMYGKEVIELFEEVKNIFDPLGIFNPRKKVGADRDFAFSHLRTKW